MKRRHFLRNAGALCGAAALGQLGLFAVRGAAASALDYKAIVCVYLNGGNDSNNMIVPIDAAGYAGYAKSRAALALPRASLLPLAEAGGVLRFGMHSALPGMHSLWHAGRLGVVANVGTLLRPLTQAQYLHTGTPRPDCLFSHIDQQRQWESAHFNSTGGLSSSGWGGRLTDQLAALNVNAAVPPMISTAGTNLFVTAAAAGALVIPTSGQFGLIAMSGTREDEARRSAMSQLLAVDRGTNLIAAAQNVMDSALTCSAVLNPILTSADGVVVARFASLAANSFARQLLAIAKVIEANSSLGARRQVFLVEMSSFDTHSDQISQQQALFEQLDAGLSAFHAAVGDIGMSDSVTSFTLSDFGRTYAANSSAGSDHGWGSHQLVVGGAVKGGKIYGTMPTLELAGPDDTDTKGRWIPTTSVDQYAAPLATWFGVNARQLAEVLPNLASFPSTPIGYI